MVEVSIISNAAPTRIAAAINISDSFTSISIAMTIAPTAINGARVTSRINMATACCVWLISAVSLVISDGVENLSSSAYEKVLMCA